MAVEDFVEKLDKDKGIDEDVGMARLMGRVHHETI